jgi:hypothetical protein
MQLLSGKFAWWVSCRDAERLLGIDRNTVSRFFRGFVEPLKILRVAKKSINNRSTRFFYNSLVPNE